jgi:hypothetical protein
MEIDDFVLLCGLKKYKLKDIKKEMVHRLHRLTQIIKRGKIRVNLCNLWTNIGDIK